MPSLDSYKTHILFSLWNSEPELGKNTVQQLICKRKKILKIIQRFCISALKGSASLEYFCSHPCTRMIYSPDLVVFCLFFQLELNGKADLVLSWCSQFWKNLIIVPHRHSTAHFTVKLFLLHFK